MTGIGYPMSMENAVVPFNGDPNRPLEYIHIGPSGCTYGAGGEKYFYPPKEKVDHRDKLIEHYEKLVYRLEKEIERLTG